MHAIDICATSPRKRPKGIGTCVPRQRNGKTGVGFGRLWNGRAIMWRGIDSGGSVFSAVGFQLPAEGREGWGCPGEESAEGKLVCRAEPTSASLLPSPSAQLSRSIPPLLPMPVQSHPGLVFLFSSTVCVCLARDRKAYVFPLALLLDEICRKLNFDANPYLAQLRRRMNLAWSLNTRNLVAASLSLQSRV